VAIEEPSDATVDLTANLSESYMSLPPQKNKPLFDQIAALAYDFKQLTIIREMKESTSKSFKLEIKEGSFDCSKSSFHYEGKKKSKCC